MPTSYKTRKSTRRMKRRHKKCFYCRTPLHTKNRTIDHKIPIAKGGTNRASNLVLACKSCNMEKGDSDFHEFAFRKAKEKNDGMKLQLGGEE